MKITYDPIKSLWNASERQLPFDRAVDFQWWDAHVVEDTRYIYPEQRLIAIGYLDRRLHVLCFTPEDSGIRVISFRKANSREARRYGKPLTTNR
ncbi:MAG: BrnT family toxin [Magnetococcales bacterium]|nr:BrnT family toxin [Magnetococcales bacterium]